MNGYALAYLLGFTPWERYGKAASASIAALLDREGDDRRCPPGRALDLGCGRGHYTRELAARGWVAGGVDNVPRAIDAASREAAHGATFVVGDVTDLWPDDRARSTSSSTSVVSRGLKAHQRRAVGGGVSALANPGATVLMLAFGPTRVSSVVGVSRADVEAAFPDWQLLSVDEARRPPVWGGRSRGRRRSGIGCAAGASSARSSGCPGTLAHDAGLPPPRRSSPSGAEFVEVVMDVEVTARHGASRVWYSRREITVIRVGGVAGVVAGALMVGHQVADLAIGGRTTDAPRSLLHVTWIVALFLAVRGVGVLQRPTSDRVGRLSVRLALAGLGVTAVLATVETARLLLGGSSTDDPPPPVVALFVGSLVLLAVGLLAFAVGVVRAGVLPRSVGVVLLVGVLTKMVAPEPVPSLAVFGLAVAWTGVAVLRRLRAGAPVMTSHR